MFQSFTNLIGYPVSIFVENGANIIGVVLDVNLTSVRIIASTGALLVVNFDGIDYFEQPRPVLTGMIG